MAGKKDEVKDSERYSILVEDLNHCYFCGSDHVHLHEVIHGTANRKKSKEDGLVLPLCQFHHSEVHNKPDLDLRLKKIAEKIWLDTYTYAGRNRDDRIVDFIKRYGINYLE